MRMRAMRKSAAAIAQPASIATPRPASVGAHAEGLDRPAENRRAEHRAQRIEAHHVAVGEAARAHDGLVHRLLRDDEQHARAGPEQHPVAERELREAGRRSRKPQPCCAQQAARERERRGREPPVELRREVHAHHERDGGEAEDEAHLGARCAEQRLHRLQEDAEGVQRAERQVDGRRGEKRRGASLSRAQWVLRWTFGNPTCFFTAAPARRRETSRRLMARYSARSCSCSCRG